MAEASEPQSAAQGAAALAANHAEQLRQTSADMENSFNFEADLTVRATLDRPGRRPSDRQRAWHSSSPQPSARVAAATL